MTNVQEIPLSSERLEAGTDMDAAVDVIESFFEKRWTDGLPVVPPTPRRVREMIASSGRDAGEVMGEIPPRHGIATIEKVAINAVMAGCKPEYFPVVLKALECCLEPQFALNAVLTTTQPYEPLVILSGPIVKKLGVNTREAVFGWGSRANGTIGRAMRLVFWNIGGAYPGEADKSSFSHPGAWSFCIGEDPDRNPWEPFHATRGVPATSSAVTVFACEAPHSVAGTGNAQWVLNTVCGAMASVGPSNLYLRGPQLLVLSPRNAESLANEGWTRPDIQAYIREHARVPAGVAKQAGMYYIIDHSSGTHNAVVAKSKQQRAGWEKWINVRSDSDMVPVIDKPEDVYILVAGGKGSFCALCPGWSSQRVAITRELPEL